MVDSYDIGEIVEILKGRDSGNYAIILEKNDERFVFIVDGDKRKFDGPKKKNIRHLRPTGLVAKEIVEHLKENDRISNAKLRYILQDYVSNHINKDIMKGE